MIRSIVIDVGAGLIQRYQEMLSRDPGLIIHSIAPLASLKSPPLKRVIVHTGFVISDADATSEAVYTDEASGTTSLLPFNAANTRRWKLPRFQTKRPTSARIVHQLPSKTLETFINDIQLNGNITLVNINVQGYADKVLASISTKRTWSVIKEVTVKVHTIDYDLYQGQAKLTDIMDTMLVHGFTVWKQTPKSQGQEAVISFRNQTAAQIGWPFRQYSLSHFVH